MKIKDLLLVVAMHLTLVRLKSSDCFKFLAKKKPTKTIIELLARLAKLMNMEEVKAAKKQTNRPSNQEKGQSKKGNGKENTLPKLQFQNYTLLNTSLCKMLDDVKMVQLLNLPHRKASIIQPSNAKKYCKYHEN